MFLNDGMGMTIMGFSFNVNGFMTFCDIIGMLIKGTLTPSTKVRILVSQPEKIKGFNSRIKPFFSDSRNLSGLSFLSNSSPGILQGNGTVENRPVF